MHIVFETERLKIRVATPDDAEFYYALWTHPQVMKFVGFPNGLQITHEEVVSKLKKPTTGVFERRLVVELKSTSAKIGECCLHGQDEERIASTDVKLLPQYWGHKYGVEIKQGLVAYLFMHTDCVAVEASPNIENIASIKMQEAVGGIKIREETYEFPEHMRSYTVPVHSVIYRVHRTNWESNRELHDKL
ncbi:MAG: GNAT family N-acetyltransferase [Chloroflexi bacterium]|nr:GNAT family N-acetyltransferase [Chloroflexota bacterium]